MKKILIGLFALSTMAMAYNDVNIYVRAGLETGKFKKVKYNGEDFTKKTPKNKGFEVGLEATQEVLPNLELGLGIGYQDHSCPKVQDDIEFHGELPLLQSVPVYLTGKYYIPLVYEFTPYLKADLGYAFNHLKSATYINIKENWNSKYSYENGIYCGIGAGIEYNNITFDIMYKITTAKLKDQDRAEHKTYKNKVDFSRATFAIGYKF